MTYLGLRTAIYAAPEMDATKAWYQQVLGIAPYFDEPFYVGFNVGGYELGLIPDGVPAGSGGAGAHVYWGVEDMAAEYARLLELGATPHEEPHDVGEGIMVAAVIDPFGNLFGIIFNPHFKLP